MELAKHPFQVVNGIEIDVEIVDLIEVLWENKFQTTNSCQAGWGSTSGKPMIWLAFKTSEDLFRFLEVLFKCIDFYEGKVCKYVSVRYSFNYHIHFPATWKDRIISHFLLGNNNFMV